MSGTPRPLLWALLRPVFRLVPTPLHGVRRAMLRACGARIAGNTKIRPSARIDKPWNISAGELTIFGDHATLLASEPITIGNRCVISQYAILATALVDPDQPAGNPDPGRMRRGPIVVEDDCWIAADTLVAPGVRVEAGVVVGSRASIEGDLPAWKVCVGHPARAIKERAFQTEKPA